MQAVTHHTIELRAYELWEQAGRPFGRSEEFWLLASTELAGNGAVPKAKKPAARSKAAAPKGKAKAVVEPAAKPKKKAAAKKSN